MPARKATATPTAVKNVGGTGVLLVHRDLYPNDVLFGTAFAFLDRCYVHLDMADADHVQVELTPRPGAVISATELAGEFKNDLVNQAVRYKLSKQTEKVRTLIVGRAIGLAQPSDEDSAQEGAPAPSGAPAPQVPDLPPEVAKLLAEEDDSLDFLDDPLGIAVPWEEKYGKKDGKGVKDAQDGKTADGK